MMVTLMLMTSMMTIPALAAEYKVDGADGGAFGKPTSTEPVTEVPTADTTNVNRSKDSAFVPPAFGSPSSNTPGTGELLTPNISGVAPSQTTSMQVGQPNTVTVGIESDNSAYPPAAEQSTPYASTTFTLPDGLINSDGSLGTLKISKLGLSVKVYENESLESLKKGAGHFKSTSCWDGNIGLAGHNRGVNCNFGEIHTLKIGDIITYTTKLGTRSYAVYFVGQIKETDYSKLGRTEDNIITLITCVRDVPAMRWCVQAKEIK